MSEDLHLLTGAYVLDALPEEDEARFEAHLAECASCAAEVAELREATAKLSVGMATPPSAGLKASVMASIAQVEQLPPSSSMSSPPSPPATAVQRRGVSRRSLFALAAAVAIIAGMAGVAIDQYRDNAATRRVNESIAAVLAQPDARTAHGAVANGGQATVVSSASKDTAVVVLKDLPDLPSGRTYQLWLIDKSKTAHSVGLADPDSDEPARVVAGVAGMAAFGLTVEPEGGSAKPSMPAAVIVPMA
ncbi:anti-sigma factor [Kribbella deserti]|uniref:Regulator of SigK n=1 Tax=Kribbella deserti TaxID=1926257 RepID=A0ABV6QJB4_9ACTN